jgi:hypothetical protein
LTLRDGSFAKMLPDTRYCKKKKKKKMGGFFDHEIFISTLLKEFLINEGNLTKARTAAKLIDMLA